MEKVINLGIPHVGEQIFEHFDTDGLIKCLDVSNTWRILVENVLLKRWKGQIIEACASKKTEIVKLLLERIEDINLNSRDNTGQNAFMVACNNGHRDVVQLLLYFSDKNTDLNARDDKGRTAIMLACYKGHTDVVKLLLNHSKDKHIDLNAKTDYGHTALMFACYEGHIDVVKLLMDHSVDKHIDLNAKTYGLGTSAFMLACKKGQKDVVELLLDYSEDENIDLYAKTNYGGTVFNLGRTKAIRQILLDHLGDKNINLYMKEKHSPKTARTMLITVKTFLNASKRSSRASTDNFALPNFRSAARALIINERRYLALSSLNSSNCPF